MKNKYKITCFILCMFFITQGFSQAKENVGQHLFPDNEKAQLMLEYLSTGVYGTGKINKICSYFKKNSDHTNFYVYRENDFGSKKRKYISSIYAVDYGKNTYNFYVDEGEYLLSSEKGYVFDPDKVTQKENLLVGYGEFSGEYIYTYDEVNYLISNSPCLNGGYCTEVKSNRSSNNYIKENKPEFLREIAANELSDEKITLAKKIKARLKTFPHTIYNCKQSSEVNQLGEYYLVDNILYKGALKEGKPEGNGYISFLSEGMTIEEIGKKIAYLEATTVFFSDGKLISMSGKEVEVALSNEVEEVHYLEGGIVSLYLKSRPEKIIITDPPLEAGERHNIMFSSKNRSWRATAILNQSFEIIAPTIAIYVRQVDSRLRVGEYYTMSGKLDGKRNIIEDKNKRVVLQGKGIKYYSNANSYSIGDWDITNNDNVCPNGTHTTYYTDGKTKETKHSYTDWGVCVEHSSSSNRSSSGYKYTPPILFSDESIKKGNAIFANPSSSSKGVAHRCPACNGAGRHYEYETVEDCDVIFEETDAGIWRKENCRDVQRVKNIRKCSRCNGKGVVNE